MIDKIIYLHIPKSAGSSLKNFLTKCIKDDSKIVRWNSKEGVQSLDKVIKRKIITGHTQFDAYKKTEALYLSVVREPKERVLSSFNYMVTRNLIYDRGFDSTSISNTVKNCKSFRKGIHSLQCRYLSGSESADITINHIKKHPFIIGTFDQLPLFLDVFLGKIDLDVSKFPTYNVGKSGYQENLVLDREAEAILSELLEEDYKLYNYLSVECNGLYSNIDDFSIDWSEIKEYFDNSKEVETKVMYTSKPSEDSLVENQERYFYEQFFVFDDEEFISKLYLVLIKRKPSEHEFKHYLSLLQSGKKSKSEIISSIRYSKEGRENNVKLLGSKVRYFITLLYSVPLVGHLFKLVINFLGQSHRMR